MATARVGDHCSDCCRGRRGRGVGVADRGPGTDAEPGGGFGRGTLGRAADGAGLLPFRRCLVLPPERVRVLSAKIEAETMLAIGNGLTFVTVLMLGPAAFLAVTTAAAGSLLR